MYNSLTLPTRFGHYQQRIGKRKQKETVRGTEIKKE